MKFKQYSDVEKNYGTVDSQQNTLNERLKWIKKVQVVTRTVADESKWLQEYMNNLETTVWQNRSQLLHCSMLMKLINLIKK